ncbi:MAG: carbonic anhydrase [Chloroflexota bacterium]|nr:carbonic anhydrase [Chloroflexota bacterium]MDQ6905720.1 carbonic anhydrase [Chloroflexota bacterium]
MSNSDDFIHADERYAANFTKGDLPMPPRRKLAVVVCMDARLDPAKFLGLEEGDAHVIRNAGGRAADAIRSLVISQQLLGTREIMVIHHTDCGMLTFTEEQLHQKLHDELHVHAEIAFLPFTDLEQSVRDDVETLRTSPLLIPDVPVRGYVYDVHTGQLHEVN